MKELEFGRQAAEIRSYVLERVTRDLCATESDSRSSLSAREVATALRLVDRFPNICTALDSKIFERELRERGLVLVGRAGPRQSSTATWTFASLGDPSPPLENGPKSTPPQPASKRMRFTLSGHLFEKERNDFIRSVVD